MTPHQQQLPAMPRDFTQPVECSFGQLREVTAAAERAGFRAIRLHVITGGYKVEFQRRHSQRNLLKPQPEARVFTIRGGVYAPTREPISVSRQEP